jgi:hypothetical protein
VADVPTSPLERRALEHWRGQGWLRLDGFTDGATCDEMHRAVVDLVRTHGVVAVDSQGASVPDPANPVLIVPESNLLGGEGRPEELVSKVFRLHRRAPFDAFVADPRVTDVVAALLGTDDIDCFVSQFIFKNPGAWGQPWHQDSLYFSFDEPTPVVALWLAISEATERNGCLHVLPGSHREPVHEHVPDRRAGANLGYVEIVDHDMSAAVPVCMSPGDVLFFGSEMMHRSSDNESDVPRAALVFHFAPAGSVDRTGSPINDWMPVRRAVP